MGSAGELCRGMERIVQLRALKTLASAADLADAAAAHDAAAAELRNAQEALSEELQHSERLSAAPLLDIDRWRIGRAVLNDLANLVETSASQKADLEAKEGVQRRGWLQDSQLEEMALERRHRALQRHSALRDEAATSEAAMSAQLRKAERQS